MDEQTIKRGPGRPRKERLPVKLIKGYWPKEGGGKALAGSEIDLPADEARAVVAAGVAVRNDAF